MRGTFVGKLGRPATPRAPVVHAALPWPVPKLAPPSTMLISILLAVLHAPAPAPTSAPNPSPALALSGPGIQDAESLRPPEVGQLAPELEHSIEWLAVEDHGRIPRLSEWRGQVAIVHTWGYYCGSCVRVGVPSIVDLMRARREDGLRAVSLTCQVQDGQPAGYTVEKGIELGIDHPMGMASAYGEWSGYLNLNVSPNLTYCFVIGRHGLITWKGDPSRDEEAFYGAVERALREPSLPVFETDPNPIFRESLALLFEGNFDKARKGIDKLTQKVARKKDEASQALHAEGTQLLERLDAWRADHLTRLEGAFESRNMEEFEAARRDLLVRFPKGPEAKRAAELFGLARKDPELEPALEAWAEWHDVLEDRPTLFPARVDAGGKKFARALGKYAKDEERAVAHGRARAWLKAYAESDQ